MEQNENTQHFHFTFKH